jgi:hypothetical protein
MTFGVIMPRATGGCAECGEQVREGGWRSAAKALEDE